jgi:hypothetical protein
MDTRGLGLQCGVLGRSNPTTERQGMVALLRPSKVAEATELNKNMAVWFSPLPVNYAFRFSGPVTPSPPAVPSMASETPNLPARRSV